MTTGTLRGEYNGHLCMCCDLTGLCAGHQDGQLVYIAALIRSNVYTFTSTFSSIIHTLLISTATAASRNSILKHHLSDRGERHHHTTPCFAPKARCMLPSSISASTTPIRRMTSLTLPQAAWRNPRFECRSSTDVSTTDALELRRRCFDPCWGCAGDSLFLYILLLWCHFFFPFLSLEVHVLFFVPTCLHCLSSKHSS
jgi:hypothetical protein